MSLHIEPFGTFGVRLAGTNAQSILKEHGEQFRQAFRDHRLVLVHDPDMDEAQGVALTKLLGNVSFASPNMKSGRDFSFISNMHSDGTLRDGELLFHADHTFFPSPLKAISLYAMAVPDKGGETLFADATLAYERLPARLKQTLEGVQARHVATYGLAQNVEHTAYDEASKSAFAAVHPVAWSHPETGQKVLFVSRLLTESIVGLDPDASEALLEELFGYIEDPAHVYTHQWHVGDYLVWDNRALQHARADFDPSQKRAMRRVPIE